MNHWKMVTRTGIEIKAKSRPGKIFEERVYEYLSCGHCSYQSVIPGVSVGSIYDMTTLRPDFGKKQRCYQSHCARCMRPATIDIPMDNAWVALCHEHAQLIIQKATKSPEVQS